MSSRLDTTPRLLEKTKAQIKRLEERPGVLPKPTPAVLALREVLEQLRERPARLQQEQIDFYGLRDWCERFQLLREVENHPGMRQRGEQLQLHLWNQVPHSRFRAIAEAVSHLATRAIPGFQMMRAGEVRYHFGKSELNRGSLLALIVNPDLVSPELLEELGICDFSSMKGDPFGRWNEKWSLRAVTLLKGVLEASRPLSTGRGERVVQIDTLSNSALRRYRGFADELSDILQEQRGRILVTQQIYRSSGGLEIPYRSIAYFDALAPALRRPKHIHRGQSDEVERLAQIEADIVSIVPGVASWGKLTPTEKDELRQFVGSVCARCDGLFGEPQHPLKRLAKSLVGAVSELKDSLGRPNASVAMNRLHSALLAMKRRQAELSSIQGFISTDDRALANEAIRSHTGLAAYAVRILGAARELEQSFPGDVLASADATSMGLADSFLRRHRIESGTVSLSSLQPYLTVSACVSDGMLLLRSALAVRDVVNGKRILKGLFALAVSDGVQREIETVRTDVLGHRPSPPDYWRAVVRLDDFASKRLSELSSGIQVAPLIEPLGAVTSALKALRGDLDRLGAERTTWEDSTERSQIENRFRSACDEFDLEAIAQALRDWLSRRNIS